MRKIFIFILILVTIGLIGSIYYYNLEFNKKIKYVQRYASGGSGQSLWRVHKKLQTEFGLPIINLEWIQFINKIRDNNVFYDLQEKVIWFIDTRYSIRCYNHFTFKNYFSWLRDQLNELPLLLSQGGDG